MHCVENCTAYIHGLSIHRVWGQLPFKCLTHIVVVTVGGTSVRNSKSCRESSSLSVFPPRLSPVWWWRWWLVGVEELLSNLRAMSWDVKRCSRALRNFSSWREIFGHSEAFRFRNDLPAVDDNVHAGVEDKEQVWEIGQDVAPEKHFHICQTKRGY